ncbi:MAG: hypothetical protein LUD27_06585, partial [Clostridia bacterium]|nr:hypothetical protein [Clostridia bacterium]
MRLDNGLEYKVYELSYTWEERQQHIDKSFDATKAYGDLLPPSKVAVAITDYDGKERFLLKALAYFISRKEIKLIDLKNFLSCTYTEAYRAVECMLYNGFVELEEIDNQNYYKS